MQGAVRIVGCLRDDEQSLARNTTPRSHRAQTRPLNRDYIPAIGLGITQVMGYGTLMYAYAVLLPEMAKDLGLSLSDVFGILSLGLFFGGLVSPVAGKLVDRFGGRWVMTIGSVAAGLALMAMGWVEGRLSLFSRSC